MANPVEESTRLNLKDDDIIEIHPENLNDSQTQDSYDNLKTSPLTSPTEASQFQLNVPSCDATSPNRNYHPAPRFQSQRFSGVSQLSSPASLTLEELSGDEYNGEEDMDFMFDDLISGKPDPLHTMEKPFRRKGPSRYIIESDSPFTMFSLRGFLNLGAVTVLLLGLIFIFAIWPVYTYLTRHSRIQLDPKTVQLSRLSGPFDASELPQPTL